MNAWDENSPVRRQAMGLAHRLVTATAMLTDDNAALTREVNAVAHESVADAELLTYVLIELGILSATLVTDLAAASGQTPAAVLQAFLLERHSAT